MKLSLTIPAFNGPNTIEAVVERVRKSAPLRTECIAVGEGTPEGTTDIVKSFSYENDTALGSQAEHGGTAAVKKELELAKEEWTIGQDADWEYDPHDFARRIERVEVADWDAVCGRVVGEVQPAGRSQWGACLSSCYFSRFRAGGRRNSLRPTPKAKKRRWNPPRDSRAKTEHSSLGC